MGFLLHHDQKTIKHPSADVGLIFIAYNLQRIFNLIDPNVLKQDLKALAFIFYALIDRFKAFYRLLIFEKQSITFF
jgi:hypothetical protein